MQKYLKFWGTRGSCPVSGPEYREFGGNTPCLEVRYGDHLIIIDAGTGIRPLGKTLTQEKSIELFLSHFHWDHIIGFPFFEPIYDKEIKINVWAPHLQGKESKDLFNQLLAGEFFPIHLDEIQAHLHFKTIPAGIPILIGPLTLNAHPTDHPGHTLCFKIKTPKQSIGYVTDNETGGLKQRDLIAFLKGVELLIHEAQYFPIEYEKKKGWGHSSLQKAIEFVNEVKPKKWLITHHDPNHSDEELKNLEKLSKTSDLLCPAEWVREGQIVTLD